jgi:hypothetical protein
MLRDHEVDEGAYLLSDWQKTFVTLSFYGLCRGEVCEKGSR